jgi:N-methylhydantoinase B
LSASAPLDPVGLEILNESLVNIVREMRGNMLHAAFSSAVCEMHDMSCAILDAEGQLIARSEGDAPAHIFSVMWSVEEILRKFDGDIHPGDVFLHNDPREGGTHLNDIAMISPLFADGRPIFFPVVRVHFEDVGGMSPGSVTAAATEMIQEGVCIPVVRAYHKGVANRDLFDVLIANMRVPHERQGDFDAMLGTCKVALERLGELVERHGAATLREGLAQLLDRTEARMRAQIRRIPAGVYAYEVAMDPRDERLEPLVIRTQVKVGDGVVEVDFEGTSPRTIGPWNLGPAGTPTGVFSIFQALLDSRGAVNSGAFRPFVVRTPHGSLLDPDIPVGFGGMGDVRRNVETAIMGALARALPDRVTGETKSSANQTIISGTGADGRRPFIFYEGPSAGTGGFLEHDGNSALRTFLEGDFGTSQSAEALEAKFPIRVEEFALREDSAGDGRHRGGLGFRRVIRFLGAQGRFTVLSDRNVLPPYGVEGAFAGEPARFYVRREGKDIMPSVVPGKVPGFPLQPDDLVVVETSGGGGYGDPLERPLAMIARDLRFGYVGADRARRHYGVVLRDDEIDRAASEARRNELRAARPLLRALVDARLAVTDGFRRCLLAPATADRLGIRPGAILELLTGRGAPLRCWAMLDARAAGDAVLLPPDSLAMLGIEAGTPVEPRLLETADAIAPELWHARLGKVA